MVIYQPNPVPPLLQAVANGQTPETGYGSAIRQAKRLKEQQAQLNQFMVDQRAQYQLDNEIAAELAKHGRFF